ncbi:carboxylating nicotinate-nucleotide diphosphorylase [candidate division NPL-UPA2 bacterium]|nr:carboxylating nicotinate-nucleotide diphosphorylase [candidate division NPL-UPA2 bacterium]
MDKSNPYLKKIIDLALEEDIGTGDLTTEAIFLQERKGEGTIIAREEGVIAGLPVAEAVFLTLSEQLLFSHQVQEGEIVAPGQEIARIQGELSFILKGERTALNFLQRLSGIATATRQLLYLIADLPTMLVDTRKTTPGHRVLEKYAVKVGGGRNHRLGLFDALLIKENHIRVAGSIKEALRRAKRYRPVTSKIEIEVRNLSEFEEASQEGADIIMLDNMSLQDMKKAVQTNINRALLEASGGITSENLRTVAETGVDMISVGALTHQIKAMDMSLLLV